MYEPIASWELNPGYHEARRTISSLAVTNDADEPGVKLCADFKDSVKKENSLQTVENERAKRPNIRNRKPTRLFLAIDLEDELSI